MDVHCATLASETVSALPLAKNAVNIDSFTGKVLQRHIRRVHADDVECVRCDFTCDNVDELLQHTASEHAQAAYREKTEPIEDNVDETDAENIDDDEETMIVVD